MRAEARTIAAVGCLFALLYGASLLLLPKRDGRFVVGDATHHYVQLRSAVFDRDLHFRNEYVTLYGLKGGEEGSEWIYEQTATGHVRNLMPVGPAMLWAPLFLLVTAGVWVAGLLGSPYPLDGYGRLFQATAGFTGIAAATAGAWLAYRAAAMVVDRRTALWATLTIWLASSAIYYSLVSPAYSHAASMLVVSLFWFAWIRSRDVQSFGRYFLMGLLIGIAGLMRWQDVVLALVPALEIAWRARRTGLAVSAGRLAATGGGVIIGFLPQMFVWHTLYGTPFTVPQGPSFMRWTEPALAAVLFSDDHGLISWTPVIAVALAGLVMLARRAPLAGAAALLYFAVSWYVNAAVADWWGGEAFGARRFVSCFPVFVIGMACVFDRMREHVTAIRAISLAFITYTLLFLVQYQAILKGLGDIVPSPKGVYGLYFARFRVPYDLLHWWWSR